MVIFSDGIGIDEIYGLCLLRLPLGMLAVHSGNFAVYMLCGAYAPVAVCMGLFLEILRRVVLCGSLALFFLFTARRVCCNRSLC